MTSETTRSPVSVGLGAMRDEAGQAIVAVGTVTRPGAPGG